MKQEAENQYEEYQVSWNNLYKTLQKYPEMYSEEDINMYKYKWVYMLTTNRCFGSNWPGVCSMIPLAEFLNHENVNVQYDYIDKEGQSIIVKEDKVKKRQEKLYRML